MPSNTVDAILDRLARLKTCFGPGDSRRVQKLLAELDRRRFSDPASLIRFHEILLFHCAYPHNETIRRASERLLATFHKRVELLAGSGDDLALFTDPTVSGVSGTGFSAIWSYDVVRFLAARYPSRAEVDWDGYKDDVQLVSVLKSFIPLFDDGAYVVSPVPYQAWIRASKRRNESDLGWLLRQFENLAIDERAKASLFDSLRLWVHWKLGNSAATRTRTRIRRSSIFFRDEPLISRKEVSLDNELENHAPLPLKKLSRKEGEKILSAGRDTMTVRYRELYGFTFPDPTHVVLVDAGRGVEFVIWGVPRERRMSLLGYHAVLILTNGVPTGYAESLALFERTEVGVNLFYTFRDGESAWIYARLLRVLRQYLNVTVFSIEPYQLGSHNVEGIEAGAFWFYRKLGFRPVEPEVKKIVDREERKLEKRPGYRTPPRILRQLAAGHLIYEAPSTLQPGAWDDFRVPNLGLAVQRHLARHIGDRGQINRHDLIAIVARRLGIKLKEFNALEHRVFSDLALVLAVIPGLSRWSKEEKSDITRIVRAKAGADELRYVKLLQRHRKLRNGLRTIGTKTP